MGDIMAISGLALKVYMVAEVIKRPIVTFHQMMTKHTQYPWPLPRRPPACPPPRPPPHPPPHPPPRPPPRPCSPLLTEYAELE